MGTLLNESMKNLETSINDMMLENQELQHDLYKVKSECKQTLNSLLRQLKNCQDMEDLKVVVVAMELDRRLQ